MDRIERIERTSCHQAHGWGFRLPFRIPFVLLPSPMVHPATAPDSEHYLRSATVRTRVQTMVEEWFVNHAVLKFSRAPPTGPTVQ